MYYLGALLVLCVGIYILVNVVRYPWHTLVFIGAGIALALVTGAGTRLWARLGASPHPAARRLVAACAGIGALARGVPPYNEARWWVARSLVQLVYWVVALGLVLGALVALGGAFVWLDRILK